MENTIFENLCAAYETAFTERGAHSPMTTDLRTMIVRYFQNAGQQKIIEINRRLSNGAVSRSGAGGDSVELKTFVHPKAVEASKKVEAVTNPGLTEQQQIPGKLGRHLKASLEGTQPHPLTTPATVPPSTPPEVPQPEVGNPAGNVAVDKLTDADRQKIRELSPSQIVSTYGEKWVVDKLKSINPNFDANDTKPGKLAAILKSQIK